MIRVLRLAAAGSALALAAAMLVPAPAHAAKSGGLLTLTQREDLPQGFAIHETATISTVWPAMPCFNNLVLFDPLKTIESADTIIGELAEKWSWQDGYRNLVFFLRKDVKWHDGKPFTSKDVKYTFDMLREAPDAPQKLRLNPRKDWYANVEAVEAADRAHGHLPAQAPAAVPPADARLRLHAGLRRARAAGQLPDRLHRDRAVQAEGVAQGRVRRVREEPRLLREGPALPRRAQVHRDQRAGHRGSRRSRPARSTCRSRTRCRRPTPSSSRRPSPSWSSPRSASTRQRQHRHEHRRSRPSTTSRCGWPSATRSTGAR